MTNQFRPSLCGCCGSACPNHSTRLSRRGFFAGIGAAAGGAALGGQLRARQRDYGTPVHDRRLPLRVQPVLVYSLNQREEGTSWRPWGGLHSEADAELERSRIRKELGGLRGVADFPLEILPLASATTAEEASRIAAQPYDVVVMYAAGGWLDVLEALTNPQRFNLVFLRHRSGPVYLWYEIISNRFLRKTVDEFGQPGVTTRDVVVDRTDELLWRLRGLAGLKNTQGKRILCVGGPSGWGRGGKKAPQLATERFGMELIDVPYEDLGRRLIRAEEDSTLVKRCHEQARAYLKGGGVTLETEEHFVRQGFVLTEVFRQLLDEFETDAITINLCMGTIMEVSGTTACLSLSLLNDEGSLAFCESDLVVIPSGVLLHYISGKPVFFNDPTYPHDGLVTLAHCTAPRKMDGTNAEPVRLLTHFESDWGVAPKVAMTLGQKLTVVDPDFNFERWMGFEGEVVDNPFLDICRSQIDVSYHCDTDRLNDETRGFHWMACYGTYLKEVEFATRKVGIDWLTLA